MNKKKKISYLKATIKIVFFLLILFICLEVVYNITKRKDAFRKMSNFFEQEEDFDVLFFGSSHTLYGIFPSELWKNYGIVSYNMGNPSETMVTTYYNMLQALKHTNPKLVVIDAFTCMWSGKIDSGREEEIVHNSLDAYPLSYIKYLAVRDIFDGNNILDKSFEYLFDFSIWHARWDEIGKNDFIDTVEYQKGARYLNGMAVPNKMSDFYSIKESYVEENINMYYMRKIIEYCKQNNIEILITIVPYPATDSQIMISKYVQSICHHHNVNYINFLSMDNLINYKTDCFDKDSHLNVLGARKVTNYLGKYIMENYNIQDQRENENYDFWNDDYNEHIDYKINLLKQYEKNLNNYLMLLYGENDIKYEIKISSKKEIKEGSTLYNLLKNLDNNYEINDNVFRNKADKTIKITTWDKRDGSLIDTLWW